MNWISKPDKDGLWLWRWCIDFQDERMGILQVCGKTLRILSGDREQDLLWRSIEDWHIDSHMEFCFVGEG